MLKTSCFIQIILAFSLLFIVSCGGAAQPAPQTVEIEKVVTAEIPTSVPACGGFEVSKIVGTWKTTRGPSQSRFTFAADCRLTANIDGTGEETGTYSLSGENKLLLALPKREGQVEMRLEGEKMLILEDAAAGVTLTLQKSSE